MSRPTKDEYFMAMARIVASRTTCLRRSVGCVLVSERGHVLATGYNGVASGLPHCNARGYDLLSEASYPHACVGALAASGHDLDACEAIHAEQNALLQCRDVWQIDACYVTTFPCVSCAKLLLGTACRRIIYSEDYAQMPEASALWTRVGRAVHYMRGTK